MFAPRVVMAITMAVMMILAPPMNVVAHSTIDTTQTEQVRHAALSQTNSDHGHSHDDGDTQERLPGHSHGHNAADHSHDTGNAVLIRVPEQGSVHGGWYRADRQIPVPDQMFRLDRPPRVPSAV